MGGAKMPYTVSVAEARNNFSKIGSEVVRSGKSVTVFRHSKPWLVISPAEGAEASDSDGSAYERELNALLERGNKELADGAYVDLAEFMAHHPRR